jgi:hypothetical protein
MNVLFAMSNIADGVSFPVLIVSAVCDYASSVMTTGSTKCVRNAIGRYVV